MKEMINNNKRLVEERYLMRPSIKVNSIFKKALSLIVSLLIVLIMSSGFKVNAYAASDYVELSIPMELSLTGDSYKASESFKFTIEALDSTAPMPAETTVSLTSGKASFGPIRYDNLENYHYRISQSSGSVANFTLDTRVYYVTVSIVRNNDGTLEYNLWAVDDPASDKKADSISFVNTYKKPSSGGGSGSGGSGGSSGGNKGYNPTTSPNETSSPSGTETTASNETSSIEPAPDGSSGANGSGGSGSGGYRIGPNGELIGEDGLPLGRAYGNGNDSDGSSAGGNGDSKSGGKKNPKTGDATHVALLAFLVLVSGCALVLLLIKKSRSDKTSEDTLNKTLDEKKREPDKNDADDNDKKD